MTPDAATSSPASAGVGAELSSESTSADAPGVTSICTSDDMFAISAGTPCQCNVCLARVGESFTLQELKLLARCIFDAAGRRNFNIELVKLHAYFATATDIDAGLIAGLNAEHFRVWRVGYGLPARSAAFGTHPNMRVVGGSRMVATGEERSLKLGFPARPVYRCSACGEDAIGVRQARNHSANCPKRPNPMESAPAKPKPFPPSLKRILNAKKKQQE